MNLANFGMAKSLVMARRAANFDVDITEGLEAWLMEAQSKPLPMSMPLVSPGASPPAPGKSAAEAMKSCRKTANESRKKNR